MTDVEVGLLLSGGLHSSIIEAIMHQSNVKKHLTALLSRLFFETMLLPNFNETLLGISFSCISISCLHRGSCIHEFFFSSQDKKLLLNE